MSAFTDYSHKHMNRKDGKAGRKGESYKRHFTDKDIQVVQQVSSGVPIKKARESVGLKTGGLSTNQKALMTDMQEAMREQFIQDSFEVYNNLKDLAFNARSELVRFNASKDILDRAGLSAPDKKEITENKFISTDSKITYDLLQRFKALELEGDDKNPEITTIEN